MSRIRSSGAILISLVAAPFALQSSTVQNPQGDFKSGTVVVSAQDVIESFAIDSQGKTICWPGTMSSTLNVLDWKTRKTLSIKMPKPVYGVCWCEKFKCWYAGLQNGEIFQVSRDLKSTTKVSGIKEEDGLPIGLMACDDEGTVYSDGPAHNPRIVKITGTSARTLDLTFEGKIQADLSVFRNRLAVVTTDPDKAEIYLYMVDTKASTILWKQTISKPPLSIFNATAAFINNGTDLALSVPEGLALYSAETGKELRHETVSPNEYGPSRAISVIDDGRALAFETVYGIKIYDLRNNQLRDLLIKPQALRMQWHPKIGLLWINDINRNELMWLSASDLRSKSP